MTASTFTLIDNAVAVQSRAATSKYSTALNDLKLATKNADGTFAGSAIECEKAGQVLSFRQAAKALGVGLVTRKQTNGKVRVWKVSKADQPVRKVASKPAPKSTKKPVTKKK